MGLKLRTLYIRNTPGGMIWQVYHVACRAERELLEKNARANGFGRFELCAGKENCEETWPDWREVGKMPLPEASDWT